MLTELQRRSKRHTLSTEASSSLKSEVHRRSSKRVEEGAGYVQRIWTACLFEINCECFLQRVSYLDRFVMT